MTRCSEGFDGKAGSGNPQPLRRASACDSLEKFDVFHRRQRVEIARLLHREPPDFRMFVIGETNLALPTAHAKDSILRPGRNTCPEDLAIDLGLNADLLLDLPYAGGLKRLPCLDPPTNQVPTARGFDLLGTPSAKKNLLPLNDQRPDEIGWDLQYDAPPQRALALYKLTPLILDEPL